VVAACGLAGGMEMKGCSVAPFILRGVTLRGIESVFLKKDIRKRVYETYTPLLLKSKKLEMITHGDEQVIELEAVPEAADKMLKGQIKGRYVVKLT
jgi:acrylyl-CoA reductase (NADPH)